MADIDDLVRKMRAAEDNYFTLRNQVHNSLLDEINSRGGNLAAVREALEVEDFDTVYGLLYANDQVKKVSDGVKVYDNGDSLVVENLTCADADGNLFEKHDKLYVKKDIERKADGSPAFFTLYKAIKHFEGRGDYLLSMAGHCNLVTALFDNIDNPEANKVLMQFKDYGFGYGWHAQNTVFPPGRVVHYPLDRDFPKDYRGGGINQGRARVERSFNPRALEGMALENALKISEAERFIKNSSGMRQPEKLIEIGQHLEKTAWFWPPVTDRVCEGWLGCGDDRFLIGAGNILSGSYASRGVQDF